MNIKGKKILVTTGPTYEHIDPVRFIGNFSTGTMGYAIAKLLHEKGADVKLVSGPVQQTLKYDGIQLFNIVTAQEMLEVCLNLFPEMDGAIMAAAVSDYRPAQYSQEKIKKKRGNKKIKLIPTVDIAKTLGLMKKKHQFMVGFALESNKGEEEAKRKLTQKKFDFIVLNSLTDKGAGFGTQTNKISIIDKQNNIDKFELKNKYEVAKDIIDKIIQLC